MLTSAGRESTGRPSFMPNCCAVCRARSRMVLSVFFALAWPMFIAAGTQCVLAAHCGQDGSCLSCVSNSMRHPSHAHVLMIMGVFRRPRLASKFRCQEAEALIRWLPVANHQAGERTQMRLLLVLPFVAVLACAPARADGVRRVVTGLDQNNKSVVLFDSRLPLKPLPGPYHITSTNLWITDSYPPELTMKDTLRPIGVSPPPNGTKFRIVEFPPLDPETEA